ncbi:peptide chain release factor 2 [Erysipelothrix rhusiopathiae]|uniref:peptide chain release factor 2 n=1 Tax=Erysipelothrix rhusiopathiae TaxID=1648 RepID=UPI001EE0A1B2|nr:peptide chain release factor 2 [Erysipelothrix rhusiopathiae]MCG4456366.1 peptide chain release factor 2 [Erysipelothrix rhusiopathiae]
MELFEIAQIVDSTTSDLKALGDSLDLAQKKAKIKELESEMVEDGFWDDHRHSSQHIQKLNQLKKVVETHHDLLERLMSCSDSILLLKEEADEEFQNSLEVEVKEIQKEMESFSVLVLLSHDYDQKNAIVEIHPGAGGTESQDFAEMLYRMYTRWAQDHGFKISVLNYLDGDEAGLKSVSFSVSGMFAYGYLKAEKGVHRLVRISPFDSSGRRHTSFASVDVAPEFDNSIEITILPEDIDVDTMRATGAGGQHVNKTDSAVRITHKKTGIVVTCQAGRSQLQNREEALMMLKSKLYQREIEDKQAQLAAIKGEHKLIEWGSQIRSYVAHPYTMVKDHRTKFETSQYGDVLDGDIDDFIEAFLKMNVGV